MNEHMMEANAPIYHEKAKLYDIFAQAEDTPNHIFNFLKTKVKGKIVVDIGCGSGKYAQLLAPHTQHYIGVDPSPQQLEIAKEKTRTQPNITYIHSQGHNTKLANKSIDVIIASWVIESIRNPKIQEETLSEMNRILKNNGTTYIIENSGDSEFEEIIKREPDISTTQQTRNYLESKGFKSINKIKSYFLFKNKEKAKFIFKEIWGEPIAKRITSNRINHNISIYEKIKQ